MLTTHQAIEIAADEDGTKHLPRGASQRPTDEEDVHRPIADLDALQPGVFIADPFIHLALQDSCDKRPFAEVGLSPFGRVFAGRRIGRAPDAEQAGGRGVEHDDDVDPGVDHQGEHSLTEGFGVGLASRVGDAFRIGNEPLHLEQIDLHPDDGIGGLLPAVGQLAQEARLLAFLHQAVEEDGRPDPQHQGEQHERKGDLPAEAKPNPRPGGRLTRAHTQEPLPAPTRVSGREVNRQSSQG